MQGGGGQVCNFFFGGVGVCLLDATSTTGSSRPKRSKPAAGGCTLNAPVPEQKKAITALGAKGFWCRIWSSRLLDWHLLKQHTSVSPDAIQWSITECHQRSPRSLEVLATFLTMEPSSVCHSDSYMQFCTKNTKDAKSIHPNPTRIDPCYQAKCHLSLRCCDM